MAKLAIIKILAVDDESNVLKALRRVFEDATIDFFSAESGFEGLTILKMGKIDVIISDYRMPGMDGIEFLTAASNLQPKSIRILLTGQAPGIDISNEIRSGVITKCISKPWDNDQLIEMINSYINTL